MCKSYKHPGKYLLIIYKNISYYLYLWKKKCHVGPSQCTWGPIEWCATLANSKKCKKTKYCMKFIWFRQQFLKPSTPVSETCVSIKTGDLPLSYTQ